MPTMLDPGAGGLPSPQEPKSTPPAPLGLPPAQEQALYGAPTSSPMMQAFGDALSQAKAQYTKLSDAAAHLGRIRVEMDKLVAMGDQVTQENVVDAAGTLVAHGLGAVPMATLLADMPKGGEALQAWLRQQDQTVRQNEEMIKAPLASARHNLAMVGLHNLVGHMAEGRAASDAEAAGPLGPQGGQQALPPPGASNDLAPTSGGQETVNAG